MKKLHKKLLLAFLLTALICIDSYSQWTMSTGIEGGEITSIASIDSTLVALSADWGLYTKTGAGEWIYSYPGSFSNYKLLKVDSCIYLTRWSQNHPLRSCDLGLTWEPDYNLNGEIMVINDVIFFGSGYRYRSFDLGATHDTITLPETLPNTYTVSMGDDSLFYVYTSDYYGYKKIHYSADYGDTWDTIPTKDLFPSQYTELDHIEYIDGNFWATTDWGTAPSRLHLYNKNSGRWVTAGNGLPFYFRGLFEFEGELFCNPSNHSAYKYDYNDSIWEEFGHPSKSIIQFVTHNDELFCATDQGIYTLGSTGNFISHNSGLNHRSISSIDTHNDNIFVSANDEIFKSEDGGLSFYPMEDAYGFQIITNESGYYTLSHHELRISYDEGVTWTSYPNWLRCSVSSNFTHMSINNQYIFLGTEEGLFRSNIDNIQWMQLNIIPPYYGATIGKVETIGNSLITNAGWNGIQYKSHNNGITYDTLGASCLFKKVDQSYWLLKDTLFYSDDRAQTWGKIRFSPQNNYNKCIDKKGDTLIVGGRSSGGTLSVLMTYDPLIHWIDISDYIPHSRDDFGYITEVLIHDGRILVGNPSYGIWYRDDILTDIGNETIPTVNEDNFVNIFPNPTSSFSTFEYNLISASMVELLIYDHLGNQSYKLQQYQHVGTNRLTWNATNQQSGIYYFQLKTNDNTITGKLLVSK